MTSRTGDILADVASAAEEMNERERYAPQDEPPDVDAPDLEDLRELNTSTDKALTNDFFRRYRHLFANGDGILHLYHSARGMWVSADVERQLLAYSMHLGDRFYDQLADLREQRQRAEAAGQVDEVGRLTERMNNVSKMILHCEKASTMSNVARFMMAKMTALLTGRPIKMNPNHEILMCENGVVELATGRLRSPRPEDYITRNTQVMFKHDADPTWWSDVVLDIFDGNPRLAEFLQVWFGYCATGYVREQCLVLLDGAGSNGKNLVYDAVSSCLGGYASVLPNSFLDITERNVGGLDNNMLYAMAQLHGIRFAYVSELAKGAKLHEAWVKSQTGDDRMRARFAHKDYFEFDVTHKVTIGSNDKPIINGTDEGIWRRIRLVPMRRTFTVRQEAIDAGLADKMADKSLLTRAKSKEGREQVLAWVVAGAKKYLAHGLDRYTPPEVIVETLSYRRDQDLLGQFLQEVSEHIPPGEVQRVQSLEGGGVQSRAFAALSIDERLRVEKQELWRIYTIWTEEHGHKPMSATMFARRIVGSQRFWVDEVGAELLMRPLEVVKSKGNASFYRYIRLNDTGRRLRGVYMHRLQQRGPERTHLGDDL